MILSADKLNLRSPYYLTRINGMAFRFVTDLYHLWFYDYARNHEMTLFSDSVTFRDTKYYTGILMRHDHPLHDIILISYQEFLKHVPERFTIREK